MIGFTNGLVALLATDAPALPDTWVMRLGLTAGWALVIALLGVVLGYKLAPGARRLLAMALVLWTLVPGPVSPDYWLGLAFHAPSLASMLLCGWGLQRLLFPSRFSATSSPTRYKPLAGTWLLGLLCLPVALGYLLLLDTFAVLPLQLYAWGFSPVLLLGLLGVSLLPWLLCGKPAGSRVPLNWMAPASLLLFAATRLPTGNVWDALLDPWLWLVLQGLLVHRLYRQWRD